MKRSRICVFGAGAIGGHLAAIQANGVALREGATKAAALEAVHAVIARLAARKGLYSPP